MLIFGCCLSFTETISLKYRIHLKFFRFSREKREENGDRRDFDSQQERPRFGLNNSRFNSRDEQNDNRRGGYGERQSRGSFGGRRDEGNSVFSRGRKRYEETGPAPVISSRNATFNISDLDNKGKKKAPVLKYYQRPKKIVEMTKEQVSSVIFKAIKDFIGLMQKNSFIETIKEELVGQEYETELFFQMFKRTQDLETRDKKSVLSLLKQLKKEGLMSLEHISAALDEVAESVSDSAAFEEYFRFFEAEGLFDDVSFSKTLLDKVTPISVILAQTDVAVENICTSEAIGDELAALFKNNFDNIELKQEDKTTVLITLLHRFVEGHKEKLLEVDGWKSFSCFFDTLFGISETELEADVETPEIKISVENKLQLQAEFLYSLQSVFAAADFPVTEESESLFEIVLFGLYSAGLIDGEGVSMWKDDKFRIITQLSEDKVFAKKQALSHSSNILDVILFQPRIVEEEELEE